MPIYCMFAWGMDMKLQQIVFLFTNKQRIFIRRLRRIHLNRVAIIADGKWNDRVAWCNVINQAF